MSNRGVCKFVYALFLLILLFAAPLKAQQKLKKKIVEIGWDIPEPRFIRDNIREMEKRPFDGIVFQTDENCHEAAHDRG